MNELEKLKTLKLHDQNFETLEFDIQKQKLTIITSIYSEQSHEYDYWEIVFLNISNFKMSELNLLTFSSLEIYSHEIIEGLNKIFIEFVMLLGIGQPTFNLSFEFTEIQVIFKNQKDL